MLCGTMLLSMPTTRRRDACDTIRHETGISKVPRRRLVEKFKTLKLECSHFSFRHSLSGLHRWWEVWVAPAFCSLEEHATPPLRCVAPSLLPCSWSTSSLAVSQWYLQVKVRWSNQLGCPNMHHFLPLVLRLPTSIPRRDHRITPISGLRTVLPTYFAGHHRVHFERTDQDVLCRQSGRCR